MQNRFWSWRGGVALLLLGQGLALGAATNETVVTADKLSFDYERFIATFQGHVVVSDPQIRLESDLLHVLFDKENSVKAVTAIGNVRIQHQDKSGSCDKAVYRTKEGEILLTGHAELRRGKDYVAGDTISLLLAEDKMTCEPGRFVFYSEPAASGDAKSGAWLKGLGTP
jgi:lipopolysaccharide export system protein LptA